MKMSSRAVALQGITPYPEPIADFFFTDNGIVTLGAHTATQGEALLDYFDLKTAHHRHHNHPRQRPLRNLEEVGAVKLPHGAANTFPLKIPPPLVHS